jgi:hypothetical protein
VRGKGAGVLADGVEGGEGVGDVGDVGDGGGGGDDGAVLEEGREGGC